MGLNLTWTPEQPDILHYQFIGTWTWDDVYYHLDKAYAHIAALNCRVDTMIDLVNSDRIPPNAITHVRNIAEREPETLGIAVFVTASPFLLQLLRLVLRLSPRARQHYRAAPTLEAARRLIAADRARDRSIYTSV